MKHIAQTLFEHAVAEFPVFQVAVDPRLATLPPAFKDAQSVTLSLEPNSRGNNSGFRITEAGFTTTMSFDRVPFLVVVPWTAFQVMATPGALVQFAVPDEVQPPKPTLKRIK